MFKVSFQNRVRHVTTWEEVEDLRRRWTHGKSRKLVQAHFKVEVV
jgi:hypothetical protein